MGENKKGLRAEAFLRRESLSASQLALWNRLIHERVLHFPPYLSSSSVALYSPIGNEVATDGIRCHALRTGKRLFYPKLGARAGLDMVQVESPEELKPGRYGILEPTGSRIMTQEDREGLVVFVPGLAFDLQGNRLGRGKGWYDRALALLGDRVRLVALAYEFQIITEKVPAESWDRRVHHIITESRIIDCGDVPSRSGWVS